MKHSIVKHLLKAGLLSTLLLGSMPAFSVGVQDDEINWNASITLPREARPLRELLKEIERQAQIWFIFDDALIDAFELTLPAEEESLQRVMQKLLVHTQLASKTFPPDAIVLYRLAAPKHPNPKVQKEIPVASEPFQALPMVPPKLLSSNVPEYPLQARGKDLEGKALVNLLVGQDGTVRDVELTKSTGSSILDQAAEQFAKKMVFLPAKQGNKPVELWIAYEIVYKRAARQELPETYVADIRDLRARLANQDSGNREKLYERFLGKIDDFSQCGQKWSVNRINNLIPDLISHQLYQQWSRFAGTHSLAFLVYHGYIKQYPDNPHIDEAGKHLAQCLKETMTPRNASEVPVFQIQANQRFTVEVKKFLEEHYPDFIETVFSE